jgi:GNAT superfamily N-acetyltransferase
MTHWVSERLVPDHDASAFNSGVASLDQWLRGHALRAEAQDTARTYVWVQAGDRRIRAYFSIAPTQVLREGLPRSASGGHSVIPGYLLGRLALDADLQHQGFGGQLLIDALTRIVRAADGAAGRLIVVDAISPEAVAFYEHYGFRRIDGSNRLFLKMATVRAHCATAA